MLIALSSVAVTQGDKIKHTYISLTQTEDWPEISESQEYDTSTFQSLVEGPGVVLTKDILLRILDPSAEKDIDAVTTATPFPAQASDTAPGQEK